MQKSRDDHVDQHVPEPADPRERREPLPWQHPKPGIEDPDAPARVQAIIDDPSYRPADQDIAFVALDATTTTRSRGNSAGSSAPRAPGSTTAVSC